MPNTHTQYLPISNIHTISTQHAHTNSTTGIHTRNTHQLFIPQRCTKHTQYTPTPYPQYTCTHTHLTIPYTNTCTCLKHRVHIQHTRTNPLDLTPMYHIAQGKANYLTTLTLHPKLTLLVFPTHYTCNTENILSSFLQHTHV